MASRELTSVLNLLVYEITEAIKLVAKINQLYQTPKKKTHISRKNYEMIVELAFLKSFIAWETFLEESFILYLMGKNSPNGYLPKRFVMPTNRQHALDFTSAEARYADWTAVDLVVTRAERYFHRGDPYSSALKQRNSQFNDTKTIRNAITHSSTYTKDKFKSLVRRELTYYPQALTPGGFLIKGVPSNTTTTFLENYLDTIIQAAKEIVR